MRKTIEELVEGIRRPTTHYADQDFYDVDIKSLLKLVRVSSLREGINQYGAFMESYCDVTLPDCNEFIETLNKDSIEL